jgi:NAD(P)-dependent dehydrogenase (short-subunit alcohol dehydrogenase family)
MELKDSVVLITGAAMRVGRQVALHLASLGANISFSYYLDDEPWQETQKELEACGVRVLATQTEVRDAAQVKALVERTVQEFGKIDVLINNASIWLKSPFLEISERDWDLAMDVNLKGPFLAAQAVAPHMLKQGQGVIINITDLSAFQVWPGYAHHSASKVLAEDAPPEKVRWSVEKSTLKRIGSPQDVARMITFLIENDFTTGAVYFVDGGRSLV